MKIRKILAGMSAAAIAATMLSVSAFAADETDPDFYPTYAPVAYSDPIQIDLASFEGIDADIASITVSLSTPKWQADWGVGGSGGLGFNYAGSEKQEWKQWDFDADASNDGRDAASSEALTTAMTNEEPFTYTFTLDEGTKTPWKVEDTDEESETFGQEISAGIIQLGVWWTAGGETVTVDELTVNFTDGTKAAVIGKDGEGTYDKAEYLEKMNDILVESPKREAAAEEALQALLDAVDEADFDDVINSMNAAADALNNAASVIAQADAAKQEIAALQDTLAEAQAALDALTEDYDIIDDAEFAAAKAKVEDAAAKLAAAQEAFENAQQAYDAETAKQLAAKDKEIADLEDEVDDLKAQLAAAPTAEEKAALEAQIAEKEAKIAELEKSVADLEKALKDAQKAAPATDDSKTESKPDTKTDDSKTDDKGSNPNTGTGALATVGVALAAAAFVVSKKRK